jgi:predicted dehydrogenase
MAEGQKNLRAGIVGLGFIGAGDQVSGDAIGQRVGDLDGTHAAALAGHPGVQLVTGSSRDEGRRKRFEQRQRVHKTYADWRRMLAEEKLDIVSVATNSPYHAEVAEACAEAGVRAVFCEKPVATRLTDADRAVRRCRERGTLLVVNHNRRWHPFWHTVRDEIASGTIGSVQHAFVHWSSGRLGNIGTHLFDLLRMILRAEAKAVSGTLDPEIAPDCRGPQFHDPGGWGIISFDDGVKAFVDAPQGKKSPLVVRVVGSLGQIDVRGDRGVIELWSGEQRDLSVAKTPQTSMDRAVREIVECLSEGARPSSTGEDGLAALEIIIGFHVSDRLRGQQVELPIRGADRELEVLIG